MPISQTHELQYQIVLSYIDASPESGQHLYFVRENGSLHL